MKDYSAEQKVYDEVKRLNLHRLPVFDTLTIEEFDFAYNGYGPDAWPAVLRGAVTWIYRNFKPLAAVHDVDFVYSNGTEEGFNDATNRWQLNSKVLLNDRYPKRKFWLLPIRAYAWCKLKLSYIALKKYSFEFYVDVFRALGNSEKN